MFEFLTMLQRWDFDTGKHKVNNLLTIIDFILVSFDRHFTEFEFFTPYILPVRDSPEIPVLLNKDDRLLTKLDPNIKLSIEELRIALRIVTMVFHDEEVKGKLF
jgi:hypothetical protein